MSKDRLLNKFLVGLKKFVSDSTPVDPHQFSDPLALKVEWLPLVSGGSNFQTHRLKNVSSGRVEFQATLGAKLFAVLFLGIGLGLLSLLVADIEFDGDMPTWLLFFMGSVFSGVGGFILYLFTKPIVFDQMRGYFWKGRQSPEQGFYGATIKDCVLLHQIHALQLLKERCSSNKSRYYSYELNLVLDDGSRINVVDHGNAAKLVDDATVLANFLNVPIWDAISPKSNS